MRFAHISDLHLCRDPQATPGVRDDITGMVEAIAEDLDRISDILDFIVLSGDLTDDAHPESFRTFVRIFKALPCPVYLVPGNHDGPAAFQSQKRDLGYLSDSDIAGRVVQIGDIRLLGLDTCIEARTTGALSASDLALLEKELYVKSSGPLVIVMHHAPFETGLHAYDAISRLEGSADFAQLLQASGARPIVLCGHIHWPFHAMWNGAACFVAGTPAAPFTSDRPFGDTPIYPIETQYSYFVHSLDTAGHHVVTPRSLPFGGHSGETFERRE